MIREWCEGCGERLTLQWSAMHCREIARCPARCGCDDWHTIGDVAEAFWTAIAHERQAARLDMRRWVVDALNAGHDMAAILKKQHFTEAATEDAADDAIAAFEIAMSWKEVGK